MDASKVQKSKAVTAQLNSVFALLATGLSGDFLYQVEWQKYLKSGVVNQLDVAFSKML